jgi:hypothetical protein
VLGPRSAVRLPDRIAWLRFLAGLTLLIALGAARQLRIVTLTAYGIAPYTGKWFFLWACVAAGAGLAALWLGSTLIPQMVARLAEVKRPYTGTQAWRIGLWALAILSFVPLTLAALHPHYGLILQGRLWLRLDLFWWQVLLLTACLMLLRRDLRASGTLAAAVVAQAAAYRTLVYLPQISTYPLSLAYSESSQLFESSLFFGRQIYGTATAWPVLNPSLHILLGLPFLIPHAPLWLHRTWQVFLICGLVAAVSWLLARRMRINNRLVAAVFAGWAYLFLLQGPIYLHLTIPVILLLAGLDPNHRVRSWVALLLASAWAGLSRINWFPVPGIIAGVLYLLEVPVSARDGSPLRYLRRPVIWLLAGTLTALAAWRLYVALSGDGAGMFVSSLTSDLLWYRLFPNSVDPIGLLPGALLVSLGPAVTIGLVLHGRIREWHPVRLAGLAAALLAVLLSGLVVSVKIGGGADLHNLDAYIVLLLLISATLFWGRHAPEQQGSEAAGQPTALPWAGVALAIAVPAVLAVAQGVPLVRRDNAAAYAAIVDLRQRADEVTRRGGKVLFIDQRMLLTFGELPGVPLVEAYDKETLVEMVMAHDQQYLGDFQQALRTQRYGMIVVGPIWTIYKDRDKPWSEENNVWVQSVASLLDCEYQGVTMKALQVGVYVPRELPLSCSNR